jgi:hypothetical protein
MSAVTYRLEINGLDSGTATFTADFHGVVLMLPREAWEKAGKPSWLNITPVSARDAAVLDDRAEIVGDVEYDSIRDKWRPTKPTGDSS